MTGFFRADGFTKRSAMMMGQAVLVYADCQSHAAESKVDVLVAVATNVVAGFLTLRLCDDGRGGRS
jgi:hypothetical protein